LLYLPLKIYFGCLEVLTKGSIPLEYFLIIVHEIGNNGVFGGDAQLKLVG
jgi:hypothetical protein